MRTIVMAVALLLAACGNDPPLAPDAGLPLCDDLACDEPATLGCDAEGVCGCKVAGRFEECLGPV